MTDDQSMFAFRYLSLIPSRLTIANCSICPLFAPYVAPEGQQTCTSEARDTRRSPFSAIIGAPNKSFSGNCWGVELGTLREGSSPTLFRCAPRIIHASS